MTIYEFTTQSSSVDGELVGGKKYINGLRAYVSPNTWSYVINENGKAMCYSFQRFGSCTPELYLQGWLDGLSKAKARKISKQCDEDNQKIV